VKWLSDAAVDHLRWVADRPDLGGTPYELAEPIARGGMGTVYRARDRRLDRDVALKVINAPAPAPGEVERMRDEARILARLEHPGIVPVHDLGTLPDGRLFYVMRLVRGRRLDEHARQERSLPALLRLFERVCEAVAFAHAHGVLHRDLKPANVMVGPFGEVLVLDWGLAKLIDHGPEGAPPSPPSSMAASGAGFISAERAGGLGGAPPSPPSSMAASGAGFISAERAGGLGGAPLAPPSSMDDAPTRTQRGTVLGTPGYMAPEQARGEVDSLDQRADVYALGAMLRFLFEARGEPAPRPVQAIARKAAAADPSERYATVAALGAEVSRFLLGLPVQAYPEGPVERVRRLAWKYRVPLLLVAAYLVMRAALALVAGI
jgi:eukaryotic-like serine/threonine-protein kinase